MNLRTCLLLVALTAPAYAQRSALSGADVQAPRRIHLILKDGSYQIVLSYKIAGKRVIYTSAERNGETEEIPLELVDLPATQRWEQQHAPADPNAPQAPPVLDPDLVKEEADRAALSPEVAPDLRLAPEDAVLALDTWHGAPELVPMSQASSDLSKLTGHHILPQRVNPRAVTHSLLELKGEKADVQMHVSQPEIYLRLDDALPSSGQALTVDTHGAQASDTPRKKPTDPSQYVIVRVDVRQDLRIVASFDTQYTGTTTRNSGDVIETTITTLPGGHWLKIVPQQPLLVGEYALVELLNEHELNLSVWDFGIHPTAPENRDVLHPEKRRPTTLERRPRN
jgi:hypothetical protein